MTEFFMAMIPPTATKQARGWGKTKSGKVISYDRANANAEGKLTAHLAKHIPPTPYTGAIRVLVKWLFPLRWQHRDGEWYTNKPDADNLCKALYDIMTKLGYWKDDAKIASSITEKFWAEVPGIYVKIEELTNADLKEISNEVSKKQKEKAGCFGCWFAEWDADGATCRRTGLNVGNPGIGCACRLET